MLGELKAGAQQSQTDRSWGMLMGFDGNYIHLGFTAPYRTAFCSSDTTRNSCCHCQAVHVCKPWIYD